MMMITPTEHRDACIALATTAVTRRRTQKFRVQDCNTVATLPVLASDVEAQLPIPPMNNSAMDGFLVHTQDLRGSGPWTLPVAGDVPAGAPPVEVPAGHAVRIMTGSAIIGSGLTVVPVEKTDIPAGPIECPQYVTIDSAVPSEEENIRYRGENVGVGDRIASAHSLIDAGTLAALISGGVHEVEVFPTVRVTVIATGNELTDPTCSDTLDESQIPDSNSSMLAHMVNDTRLATARVLRVSDDPDAFSLAVAEAAATSDLIITSGGISAGAFDVVKESLSSDRTQETSSMWFGKVLMKPGKPQGRGTVGNAIVICLPGNPVSSFVSFHLFARPVIQTLSGMQPQPLTSFQAPITGTLPLAQDRDIFVPAIFDLHKSASVTPVPYASHFVGSLAGVNAFIHVPVASDQGPKIIPLNF
nr:molybdopterin molybdotransferase MoeA [Corynebacterium diphtheriae]